MGLCIQVYVCACAWLCVYSCMCVCMRLCLSMCVCVPCGSSHQTSPVHCLLWPLNAASQHAVHWLHVRVRVCVFVCASISEWIAKGDPTLCCKSEPSQARLSLLIILIQAVRRTALGMQAWSLPLYLPHTLLRATLTLTIPTAAYPLMNQVDGWWRKEKGEGVGCGQKKHVVPKACRDPGRRGLSVRDGLVWHCVDTPSLWKQKHPLP